MARNVSLLALGPSAQAQALEQLRTTHTPGDKKPSKYGNVKCEYRGMAFDSKAELRRYIQLEAMQKLGEIAELKTQVDFPLLYEGEKVAVYRADFTYLKDGKLVVEDVKSRPTITPLFRLKAKLFEKFYKFKITIMEGL